MSTPTKPAEEIVEILIVEDSPTQAEKLKYVLEKKGYQVALVRNGRQALACVNGYPPALVISDIIMPEMNGYDLCRHIKANARTRDIPVILLTSLAKSDEVLEALICGADSFITKPYSEDYLLTSLESFLANRVVHQAERARVEVKIHQADTSRVITVNPQQMLGLLLSTHEAASYRNTELIAAQDELSSLNERLENQVAKRTEALSVEIAGHELAEERLKTNAAQLESSNRDLRDFAYVASHDLQEPLRKIQAFGDLVLIKYSEALSAGGRECLQRMISSSARMSGMIQDLLDYSLVTSQARTFVPVDLTVVLQDVISDLEVRIQQTGGRVEASALPTILADPLQMHKLLLNLVDNALKFHQPDVPPAITVGTRYDSPKQIQILVQDNGIGFDEKYLDRIFLPFQRLHGRDSEYAGTGFGLAICHKIVLQHNGSITAQSAPGQGSTFIVTLPAEPPDTEGAS